MVKAQDLPVSEVQDCVAACADWLEMNGFCYEAANPPPPVPRADEVIYRLRPAAGAANQPKAGAVKSILIWLHWSVLPGIDDRRRADRQQRRANASPPALAAQRKRADLVFGDDEERFAERVRVVLNTQIGLEKHVRRIHERQRSRAPMIKQSSSHDVMHRYRRWVDEGEALVRTLLSTSSGRRIPRTMRDWAATRVLLEGN